ncbi:TlpA family protein disulfide reductase [Chitinophaga sp. G-6-1-13]|uniref:TlpA family protein disulfide reductase n=1 Tax=Chitinophaga fulva TaxID=2728842 RepID=A0A848GV56_9BACT|nr:TlpA disulfide reductase family protein [Chitinophaga fulva]NML41997.1 TlpA family protein disulfide reductase [Chitinophaga fulva]
MTVLTRTLAFLLVLLSMQSFATPRHFKVTIMVPPGTREQDLFISYEDGKDYNRITPHLAGNKMEISGDYYGFYATILVAYKGPGADDAMMSRSWVNEQPATICITNDWKHPALAHATDVGKAGDSAFYAFIADAEKDRDNYWDQHEQAILQLDSPERKIFFEKLKVVDNRKLAFLQQVKGSYYALWLIRKNLVGLGSVVPYGYDGVTPAQLRTLLELNVPKKKEYAFERENVLRWLAAREVGPGVQAPDFTTTDTQGNKISLADYKGKYVLLNFWASWCEPCVAELPAIKKIHGLYSRDQLAVIGVSADKDTTAFLKAVEKYEVSWIKLKWDDTFTDKYAVASLPRLFLIDPTGKIIYERKQERSDQIDSLPLLQDILREKLNR